MRARSAAARKSGIASAGTHRHRQPTVSAMNGAYQHHEQRVALQNAAQQPAQETPRSHARGRGIRHLAEHGSIDIQVGVVTHPYEWSATTPSRPPYEPELRPATSLGFTSVVDPRITSADDPRNQTAGQPWAGLQSPRVRVSGIFDTSGETWRSPDAQDHGLMPLKRAPSHPVPDASGMTLTPGSLVPNPRTAPVSQDQDSARTAGLETSGTSAATAYEGSSVRPRGIRTSHDPPDCDTAGSRTAAARSAHIPPAGGDSATMSGTMWWHTAAPGSGPAGGGTSLF